MGPGKLCHSAGDLVARRGGFIGIRFWFDQSPGGVWCGICATLPIGDYHPPGFSAGSSCCAAYRCRPGMEDTLPVGRGYPGARCLWIARIHSGRYRGNHCSSVRIRKACVCPYTRRDGHCGATSLWARISTRIFPVRSSRMQPDGIRGARCRARDIWRSGRGAQGVRAWLPPVSRLAEHRCAACCRRYVDAHP